MILIAKYKMCFRTHKNCKMEYWANKALSLGKFLLCKVQILKNTDGKSSKNLFKLRITFYGFRWDRFQWF